MLLVMVTYTHNDAGLLNDLLGSMRRWSVKPAHVFIVDDASEQLYALPGELKEDFGGSAALSAQAENSPKRGTPLPGLDVLRPGERMGPAQAKSFGISLAFDAGADVVLSVDCDVRLPRHWLKEALHMTCQEKVGLVGSDLRHGLAGDALSDYLREFEATPHGIVETPFLEAGVWVFAQRRVARGRRAHRPHAIHTRRPVFKQHVYKFGLHPNRPQRPTRHPGKAPAGEKPLQPPAALSGLRRA